MASPRSPPPSRCLPASSPAWRSPRASLGACRCSASSASGSRFRSAAMPARPSRGCSAVRPCSCTPSASRSGSGRCCRSLWARVSRSRGAPPARRARALLPRDRPVVVLLVVSGVWLAVVQLGRVDALWTTSYGQVLACKLAAVAVLFALAAANRYRLVPQFERDGGAAARPLAISIAFELAIALAILGLVALWRFTPPPRALATDAPISLHIHGDKAMAQIEIERPSSEARRRACWCSMARSSRSPPRRSRWCSPIRRPGSSPPPECDARRREWESGATEQVADRRPAHSGRRTLEPAGRNPDQRFREADARGHGHAAAPAVSPKR